MPLRMSAILYLPEEVFSCDAIWSAVTAVFTQLCHSGAMSQFLPISTCQRLKPFIVIMQVTLQSSYVGIFACRPWTSTIDALLNGCDTYRGVEFSRTARVKS